MCIRDRYNTRPPRQDQHQRHHHRHRHHHRNNTNTNATTIAIAITIATTPTPTPPPSPSPSPSQQPSLSIALLAWNSAHGFSPWVWGALGSMTRVDGVRPASGAEPGCCGALPCGAWQPVARRSKPDFYVQRVLALVRCPSGGRCGGRSWSIGPWSTSRCCGASPGPSSAGSAASREAPP